MADLRPYPLGALVRRMFRELDRRQTIFDLPARRFFLGDAERDLSVSFNGHACSTPFGPAAGPHTQLAQNIVLSWLGGGRIVELKTVQVKDDLVIPRPCIDMQTVGFNVEWSQELSLQESAVEYVKAAILLRVLEASRVLDLAPGFGETIFDMSLGYDLAGLTSNRVQRFIGMMRDARPIIDRLRREIPDEWQAFRDLAFPVAISDSVTLSTFHGCPPQEIERMADVVMRQGLHCIVKLNPMLLGGADTRRILHDQLGYREIEVPDSAFARDTTWTQMVDFTGRLAESARSLGVGFGVKFTNTLIVRNHRHFFPATEREMYLSGPPLHVLAMQLVGRFRQAFADTVPISFSGGIDRLNFPDAVALGLVPVTVCTDLLKTGGYERARGYFVNLVNRMRAAEAATIDDLVIRAFGLGAPALATLNLDDNTRARCEAALTTAGNLRAAAGPDVYRRWVSAARVLNTAHYAARVLDDDRYSAARNRQVPRKIGSHLALFDCITCDKCVPVCPNDANFTFVLPAMRIPIVKAWHDGHAWRTRVDDELVIEEKHQIANFADFCNDCGNCDVFCPEDGGPYLIKPRFFGSREAWAGRPVKAGFYVEPRLDGALVLGRFDDREFTAEVQGGVVRFSGASFTVTFREDDPEGSLDGQASGEIDLTYFRIMNWLRVAVLDPSAVNYVNCLEERVTDRSPGP